MEYTKEAWEKECREADGTSLFYLLGLYTNGNPMRWGKEQIDVLRAEINRRRPEATP